MVALVANYLRRMYRRRGATYTILGTESSTTLSWAADHGMQRAVEEHAPQVILISLGSNELFDPAPEGRAAAIRTVVAETGGRPCLWIGPPAWKRDRGFLAVLQANLGHCHYLDSLELKLPRGPDGKHPNWTGGYRWASRVWELLGGTEELPSQ
jgi:hypothetical protein